MISIHDPRRSQSGRLQFSPDSLEHEEQSRRIRSSSIPPCRTRGALRRSPSFRLGENRDAEGFTTPPAKYVLESDSLLYSEQSIGVRARDRANQMRAEISRLRVRQRSICDASGLAVLNPLQFPGKHASSGLTDSLPLRKSPQNTRTCSTAGSNTLRDNNCTCGIYKSGGSRQQSAAGAIPSHAGSMCKSYFVCPLTKEVMEDPVLLADSGHTFERSAIEVRPVDYWVHPSYAVKPLTLRDNRAGMDSR